jgi:hypothetical protein
MWVLNSDAPKLPYRYWLRVIGYWEDKTGVGIGIGIGSRPPPPGGSVGVCGYVGVALPPKTVVFVMLVFPGTKDNPGGRDEAQETHTRTDNRDIEAAGGWRARGRRS